MTMPGRRDFLLALVGVGTGLLMRAPDPRPAIAGDCAALATWLRGQGARFFPDLPPLSRLGALYLRAHPEEGSAAPLSRVLLSGTDGTVATRLLGAISRDWSSHHVVVVDGWLMARTEARLCAFLHLQEQAGR